jgi:RNA polymerase sigma factor (sigma-70 family)
MNIVTKPEDLALAQEACEELRAGNNDGILPVYHKYQLIFIKITYKRLKDFATENLVLSILDDFWTGLLNAKAICNFRGMASLKTFLVKILYNRITDHQRQQIRKSKEAKNTISQGDSERLEDENSSPEIDLIAKEKVRLVHETLLMLTDSSPKDAYLIKMQMEGLSYQEMAERLLDNEPKSDRELKKKTDAIKKQVTRKTSGSLAKFKSCLERIMIKNHLAYSDLVN